MMAFILFSFVFILNFLISSAQIPVLGNCPDKRPLGPVDVRKFSGVWYEVERTSSLAEWPYRCISFKVQPFFEHKSTIKVSAIHRFSGKLETHTIPISNPGSSEGKDGKLFVNMTTDGIHLSRRPIQILASDNDTKIWGIAWSCNYFEKAKVHTESVWVFTRHRIVEQSLWDEIREKLRSLNLEDQVTRETLQTECAKEDEETEDEHR